MKKSILIASLSIGFAAAASADLVFSQYVETDSGTTPKGVEVWNTGASAIDFSVNNLVIQKGVNGGAPATDFTLSSGILAANDVWVIGSSDIGTYLDNTFGVGVKNFSAKSFTYNGDDALVLQLGGVTTDVIGTPGVDPGSSWSGNGVSTANQNIALKSGITTGDTDGWTDPSIRFETISSTPSQAGGLSGFGEAPTVIPEPTSLALFSLALAGIGLIRRKRA